MKKQEFDYPGLVLSIGVILILLTGLFFAGALERKPELKSQKMSKKPATEIIYLVPENCQTCPENPVPTYIAINASIRKEKFTLPYPLLIIIHKDRATIIGGRRDFTGRFYFDPMDITIGGCRIGIDYLCSEARDKFYGMLLNFTKKDLECMNKVGIDPAVIKECIRYDAPSIVKQDIDLVSQKGAWASPTMFINGRRIEVIKRDLGINRRDVNAFKTFFCCVLKNKPKFCTGNEKCAEDWPKNITNPVFEYYVVAFCPYGSEVLKSIADLVVNYNLTKYVDIRPVYIYQDVLLEKGIFNSMHGYSEARENIIQECIYRNYGIETFSKYILCYYS